MLSDLLKIKNNKKEFLMENAILNIINSKTVLLVLLVLEFGLTLIRICLYRENLINQKNIFIAMFTIIICFSSVYISITKWIVKKKDENYKRVRSIEYLFIVFVLFWCMEICFLELEFYGHITIYVVGIISVSVITCIEPLHSAVILILVQAVFIAGLIKLNVYNQIISGDIMYSTLAIIFSWFISRKLYLNRMNDFINRSEIKERSRQIQIANEKLKDTNILLEQLTLIDPLTGIANRRNFDKAIASEWKRAQREGTPLALLICDIDYFKAYNDNYGHPEGDICLVKVAKAILNSVERASDFVGRFGGEEFVILLPNTNMTGAEIISNRIKDNVGKLNIIHNYSEVSNIVTLSIGISVTNPKRDMTIMDFIKAADQALYEAKAKGRNTIISKVY